MIEVVRVLRMVSFEEGNEGGKMRFCEPGKCADLAHQMYE